MSTVEERLLFEDKSNFKKRLLSHVLLLLSSVILSIIIFYVLMFVDRRNLVNRVERFMLMQPVNSQVNNSFINCYEVILINDLKGIQVSTNAFKDLIAASLAILQGDSYFNILPYGDYYDYENERIISEWRSSCNLDEKIAAATPYNQQGYMISKLNGSNGEYWITNYISKGAVYLTSKSINDPKAVYEQTMTELTGSDGIQKSFSWINESSEFASKYYYLASNNPRYNKKIFAMGGPDKPFTAYESNDEWVVFIEKESATARIVANYEARNSIFWVLVLICSGLGLLAVLCIETNNQLWKLAIRNKAWIKEDGSEAIMFILPFFGICKMKVIKSDKEELSSIRFSSDRRIIKAQNGTIHHFSIESNSTIVFDGVYYMLK